MADDPGGCSIPMKRLVAGLLTIALMGGLLWSGARRSPSTATSAAPAADGVSDGGLSPAEARVKGLLKSGAEGDVAAYLDAFTGPLRRRLEREVGERGRGAFADDLRRAARARKSHAVFAAESDGGGAARVTVETVYPDRNERQTFRVELGDGGWYVADVETVRSLQPEEKYGSPANYIAPEGMPVEGAMRVETGDESPTTAGDTETDPP